MKLQFCRENLPILVALKDHDTIIEAMQPLVKNNARVFVLTKTPSFVLEEADYIQSAYEAIIEAVNACEIAPKSDGHYDYEEYWAKFINLCRLKMRSKLIELQKKFYLPVHVSQKIARLHPKVHEMSQTQEVTIEKIMKEFGVSEAIAQELIDITKAEFDTLIVTNNDSENSSVDVPVENDQVSTIFVEELLNLLLPLEREVIEAVVFENMSIKDFTRTNNVGYPQALKAYHNGIAKLREHVENG